MFHPAKEVKEILETLVVVVKVLSMGMTTLVMAETSVVKVALVAAMMMMDMVAVGTAIMDLVMMEAVFEVAESTVILAITTISLQVLDPGQEETSEDEVQAFVAVEASTLPNLETKMAMVVPAAAVAGAVAEALTTARKQSLAGEESREGTGKRQITTDL